MRRVRVVNRSRDQVLAERAELATSFWSRFWGLMGRRELPAGGGLVLQPGGGIHMWFMRMPLDVLHIDKHDRVTHVHVKDRKLHDGPNVPFGEGATPVT